jgi:FMN phosphatase YigB (HAD superfamily)
VPGAIAGGAYYRTFFNHLRRETRLPHEIIRQGFEPLIPEYAYIIPLTLNMHEPLKEKYGNIDLVDRFQHIVHTAIDTYKRIARPDPEIVDGFRALKNQGAKLIFFTEGPYSYTAMKLAGSPLAHLADSIYIAEEKEADPLHPIKKYYSCEDSKEKFIVLPKNFKQSTDGLKAVLEHHRICPKETMVWGDKLNRDIKPAFDLGMPTVLVTYHTDEFPDTRLAADNLFIFGNGEGMKSWHSTPYSALDTLDYHPDFVLTAPRQMAAATAHLSSPADSLIEGYRRRSQYRYSNQIKR